MLYSSQFCFRDMGSEPLCGTFLFMRHRAELTSRAQVSRQGTSYKFMEFPGMRICFQEFLDQQNFNGQLWDQLTLVLFCDYYN